MSPRDSFQERIERQKRIAQHIDQRKFSCWFIAGSTAVILAVYAYMHWLGKPPAEYSLIEVAAQAAIAMGGFLVVLGLVYYKVLRPAMIAAGAENNH